MRIGGLRIERVRVARNVCLSQRAHRAHQSAIVETAAEVIYEPFYPNTLLSVKQ